MNLTDSRKFALLQAAAILATRHPAYTDPNADVAEAEELLAVIEQRAGDRKYVPSRADVKTTTI